MSSSERDSAHCTSGIGGNTFGTFHYPPVPALTSAQGWGPRSSSATPSMSKPRNPPLSSSSSTSIGSPQLEADQSRSNPGAQLPSSHLMNPESSTPQNQSQDSPVTHLSKSTGGEAQAETMPTTLNNESQSYSEVLRILRTNSQNVRDRSLPRLVLYNINNDSDSINLDDKNGRSSSTTHEPNRSNNHEKKPTDSIAPPHEERVSSAQEARDRVPQHCSMRSSSHKPKAFTSGAILLIVLLVWLVVVH